MSNQLREIWALQEKMHSSDQTFHAVEKKALTKFDKKTVVESN